MSLIRRSVPLFTRIIRVLPVTAPTREIHRWVAPTLKEFKRREDKNGGKVVHPRNQFLEWNLEAELFAFGKRLNEDFDADLLLEAFTDRSYVIKEEMKQRELGVEIQMKDNRDLGVEGDKFLTNYIQAYLEQVLPKFPMEGVASVRQHLTSVETLAHISSHLGTKDIILAAEYPVDYSTLAQTMKALVGALLKSSGEEKTAHFVRDFVITHLQGKDINDYWHISDPWSLLTGLLQNAGLQVEPRLIGQTGSNTLLACNRVGLYVEKKMISAGFGESQEIAKEMASREALKKIFGTTDHMHPINFKLEGIPSGACEARYQIASS